MEFKRLNDDESREHYRERINKILTNIIEVSNKTSDLNMLADCYHLSMNMYEELDKYRVEYMAKMIGANKIK
jgi:uncharacterized protein (DUF2225 family)